MSWLARSIANTLRLDDDDDQDQDYSVIHDIRDDDAHNPPPQNDAGNSILLHPSESLDLEEVDLQEDRVDNENINYNSHNCNYDNGNINRNCEDDDDYNQGRGVREDLSEFKETLTRQLWGVASFLAPPPPPPPPPPPLPRRSGYWLESDQGRGEVSRSSDSGDEEYETEGQFRESPEDFVQMGMEEEEEDDFIGDAVGITEEALAFAQNIAHHPETWLDFPLSDEEEFDEFEISESQYKHARAIEHLAPRLAALRRELCPPHLSEGYFWMVYFVLLHSRLNKHDADLLSTPQLVKARAMWMKELQKQSEPEPDWLGRDTFHTKEDLYFPHENLDSPSYSEATPRYMSHTDFSIEPMTAHPSTDFEIEKHSLESHAVQFIDKSVIEEDPANKTGIGSVIGPSYKVQIQDFDDDGDDWLEDNPELEGYIGTASTLVNEEDVSFSDLEDDLDYTIPMKSKTVSKDSTAFAKTS